MVTLLILIYASLCIAAFKLLKLPATKWTITTAALAGVVLIGGLMILLNYNHPFTKEARLYFYATPINPSVSGKVIEVTARPNTPLKAGDVLFRLDPRPYEDIVAQRRAALAKAQQNVLKLKAAVDAAVAVTSQALAMRDLAKSQYDRYQAANEMPKSVRPYSEAAVEDRRDAYLAAEGTLASAKAQAEQARLAASSEIDGTDTSVAEIQAQLAHAEYQLGETVIRAPTDGYATQLFLHPGMMAVPLPIRPVMVFVHSDQKVFAATFRQNSLQRVADGDDVEISFTAIPGQVFHGKVRTILDAIPQGQLEPSGTLFAPERNLAPGEAIVLIDITDDLSPYRLPGGVTAEVAILTQHVRELAIVRRILLRMRAWMNYVFL